MSCRICMSGSIDFLVGESWRIDVAMYGKGRVFVCTILQQKNRRRLLGKLSPRRITIILS